LYNDTRNPHLPPIAETLYEQARKAYDSEPQFQELEKEIANPQAENEEAPIEDEPEEEEEDDDELIEEDDELIDVV
jgi:hypothetical protein